MDITNSQSSNPAGKTPIPSKLAQALAQTGDENEILRCEINKGFKLIGEEYEKAIIEVAQKHNCSTEEVKAILAHSQTVRVNG